MQKTILAIIVVLAVLIIGWALWPSGEAPQPEPEPVTAPPTPDLTRPEPVDTAPIEAPGPAQPVEPEVVLPPLPDSDVFVRERIEPMNLPPAWVDQGDYVRRLAVLAENASRGTLPRRQLAFLAPSGPFKVVERGDEVFIDPVSYDRYDRYVAQLDSVEPARLAGLLETINPLMESALAEIGVEAPPGQVFAAAVREVLSVPVLDGQIELIQPNVMYQYADPELEALSPLKKQVLRMGPDNVRKLQAYLRRLAAEMKLEV
ncbi:MAG: DUF3014 domain-containing protein [Pseudomonadales bacterium]